MFPSYSIPFYNPLENINTTAQIPLFHALTSEQHHHPLLAFADKRCSNLGDKNSSAISRYIVNLLPARLPDEATADEHLTFIHAYFKALNSLPVGIHGDSLFVSIPVPELRSVDPAYIYLCDKHTLVTHYPTYEFPLEEEILEGHYNGAALTFAPCWVELLSIPRAHLHTEPQPDTVTLLTPDEAAETKLCHLTTLDPTIGETTRKINMPTLSDDLIESIDSETVESFYRSFNQDYLNGREVLETVQRTIN